MPASPADLEQLKRPFGTLVADKDVTKRRILSMIEHSKLVVAVGDATTERLVSFGVIPAVAVMDGRERRLPREYPRSYVATELQCSNPKGTVSKEAVAVLQEALGRKSPVRVLVDGEEDLLALPLFAMVPKGSVVLYGQPLEGLVVVKITAAKQRQARELMDRLN